MPERRAEKPKGRESKGQDEVCTQHGVPSLSKEVLWLQGWSWGRAGWGGHRGWGVRSGVRDLDPRKKGHSQPYRQH